MLDANNSAPPLVSLPNSHDLVTGTTATTSASEAVKSQTSKFKPAKTV